jgi:GDP-4-dehydro-6-deoxy-D-mannose reductase
MKVLITGILGFVGSHLAEYCLERGEVEVFGIDRGNNFENLSEVLHKITLLKCDIGDRVNLTNIIREVTPDWIFHLAALTSSADRELYEINLFGTLNLFEAIREVGLDSKILVTGSSAEYGFQEEAPIKETSPLRPITPYGVSKTAQSMLSYQYAVNYEMKIVRSRAFNIIGPREKPEYVCSDFAKQIAEIEKGKKESILHVGALEKRRDFVDVRDVVRGYWLLLERGIVGEVYNLCSGISYSIREVLEQLLQISSSQPKVVQEESRIRRGDVQVQIGDYQKINKLSKWKPTIPLTQSLADLLNFWRGKIRD